MSETEPSVATGLDFIAMACEVTCAYVSNNHVQAAELPALIAGIHAAMAGLGQGSVAEPAAAEKPTTAQVRKSVTPDALISFEDGKPYKTLRRHLTLRGLSPEAYRTKWGLPTDYPMTAASYSAQRSALAKELGLGNQRRRHVAAESVVPVEEPPAKPKRRGRAKAEATEA